MAHTCRDDILSAMLGLRTILLAVAAALVCAGAARAQAGPDARFEDGSGVDWTAAPNYAEAWNAMEDAGLRRSDEGSWAVVACTIAENRRLTECGVYEESAPDSDIANAILSLARRYRAASTDRNGQSSIGRRVFLAWGYGGTFIP